MTLVNSSPDQSLPQTDKERAASFYQFDEPTDFSNTVVFIVGTIHRGHATNPNYTYEDLFNILRDTHPDALCVELLPGQMQDRTYQEKKDNEFARLALEALKLGIPVYGIDADEGKDDASTFFRHLEENQHGAYLFDRLRPVLVRCYNELFDAKTLNSCDELNEWLYDYLLFCMQGNKEAVETFNSFWVTRNRKMMNLIIDVIKRHIGERVMIATGNDHKYFFKECLGTLKGVTVKEFWGVSLKGGLESQVR